MAERVKVTEAVRRAGVPGDVIFLAIRHDEISSQRDDRGYGWVDPDEVAAQRFRGRPSTQVPMIETASAAAPTDPQSARRQRARTSG
jgi:hypothetical protein